MSLHILAALFFSHIVAAQSAWLHFETKDRALGDRVSQILDDAFGRQRSNVYADPFQTKWNYLIDDHQAEWVNHTMVKEGLDSFRIRRPTHDAAEWFEEFDRLGRHATAPSDDDTIRLARSILSQLDQLIRTYTLNQEGTRVDREGMASSSRSVGTSGVRSFDA